MTIPTDIKVVILAGGLGSRISEETVLKPKPMIEIGGLPILWHIMKIYSHYGFRQFIICLGYKGYAIKEYFSNYFLHTSDVTFHLAEDRVEIHQNRAEPWSVTLVDTGEMTQTGGRIKRVLPYVEKDEIFALTYGDGLANIDLQAQLAFHRAHGRKATVTSVRPPSRFGALTIEDDRVMNFSEKAAADAGWINGGFYLLSPSVGELIPGDDTIWEHQPIESLVKMGELSAFHHESFWHPMDTLRERTFLQEEWARGSAAWKIW
jgi:glucose-1-phosphate cytidylyltransferase